MLHIDWPACGNDQYHLVVEVRLFGGPHDGQVLRAEARDPQVTEVDGVLWQTGGGQLAENYYTLSDYVRRSFSGIRFADVPAAIALGMIPFTHCYEVTARLKRGNCIQLHLEHRGAAS